MEEEENTIISSYIHNAYRSNIGKIAVLLKSRVKENNGDARDLGKKLCMHIAASKPIAMDVDKLDEKLVLNEKEVQIESIKSTGKPDNIVEKILEGKMKKFYSESTLLNQPFIMDSDKTVSQVLDQFSVNNKFEILEYKLIILGS